MTAAPGAAVGLVGLGLVGQALARRLLAAGYGVVGCDVALDAASTASEIGARIAPTPRAVAASCAVVMLSLPDSDAVAEVLWRPDGIAAGATEGATILDATTADPAQTIAHHARLAGRAIAFVDTPLVGSSVEIAAGDAIALVGGAGPDAAFLAPLRACVRALHVCGGSGQGHRAKLIVNLVLGLNRLALAEGLGLADRCGMDTGQILEILETSGARSAVMQSKGRKMLDRAFEPPAARLAQHAKDVGLIERLAGEVDARVPVSRLHASLLAEAIERGWGGLDNAAVLNLFAPPKA
jgi:3-hydroxyisobutyrate dehydrogenase-like beta-hydroxyacid dehydrogenase